MAARALNAARAPIPASERVVLEAELAMHRIRKHKPKPVKKTTILPVDPSRPIVPYCLKWLQRQTLLLDARADKGEFLDLIQDAIDIASRE